MLTIRSRRYPAIKGQMVQWYFYDLLFLDSTAVVLGLEGVEWQGKLFQISRVKVCEVILRWSLWVAH